MKSERKSVKVSDEVHPAWLAFFRQVKVLAARLDALEAEDKQK